MNFLSHKSTICTTFTCTQNHFSCTHIHTYMCTCIHTCQVYITHHSITCSTFTLTFAYFLHIKHAFTHTKMYMQSNAVISHQQIQIFYMKQSTLAQ